MRWRGVGSDWGCRWKSCRAMWGGEVEDGEVDRVNVGSKYYLKREGFWVMVVGWVVSLGLGFLFLDQGWGFGGVVFWVLF